MDRFFLVDLQGLLYPLHLVNQLNQYYLLHQYYPLDRQHQNRQVRLLNLLILQDQLHLFHLLIRFYL